MEPSIRPAPAPSKMAIVVLSPEGLALARRLRAAVPEATAIFGPSCIVGACGGPGAGTSALPAGTFPTGEPGVFGWTGPLRRVFPGIWDRFDAIVAVMAVGMLVRLVGPRAGDRWREPAVVAIDEAGRFAVSVLGGHGPGRGHVLGSEELAVRLAKQIGAAPVVTTRARSSRKGSPPGIGRR